MYFTFIREFKAGNIDAHKLTIINSFNDYDMAVYFLLLLPFYIPIILDSKNLFYFYYKITQTPYLQQPRAIVAEEDTCVCMLCKYAYALDYALLA